VLYLRGSVKTMCCSVLHCVAVRCNVLQCVAVREMVPFPVSEAV